MTFPQPARDKSSLRKEMRRLAAQHDHTTDPSNLSIWLSRHPECRRIASFAALPGEPDLLRLVGLFAERCWCFPKIQGNDLSFHPVVAPGRELQSGAFGILEPSSDGAAIRIDEIDLFLCPGLAFTVRGLRLGRGKGFYDRVLSRAAPSCIRLGIAFPWQLVPDVFAEPHDIAMHELILV